VASQKPTPLINLRERLQAVGLRCTAARLTVLQHLVDNTGPKTHAEVSDALADKGFDRATIYRNLTELTEAGILSRRMRLAAMRRVIRILSAPAAVRSRAWTM
jgi:Fur family ferric uptake transcriptional regulator